MSNSQQWQPIEASQAAKQWERAEQLMDALILAAEAREAARGQQENRTTHGGNVASGTPFYLQPGECSPEYDQGHSVVVWYDDLYDLGERVVKAERALAALKGAQ